ncbi:MAG: hypothetical protein KKE62_04120 [Proteobacteria bacterium]|nr:hypothetical protein [Pseudomonadota bacterium]MBU1387946.1 hypothetical protein [Pseudomonadota bacterium]MBU1542009.1 hypothetical protein [Pseudomonadota bacterium]MBU2430566.1 hypothetical protein [Pseudomonadota bacterium]MBU2480576.1 hypothetical protein [Pseudomonadota bacterium]
MNDFLQSLRNGQAEKPRTPKTRKNHDNSYHYTSAPRFHSYGGYQNTRNQQPIKRPPAQLQPGNQLPADELSTTSLLAEAIEDLNAHIETLANNQNYLIAVQEKTADMLERQAIAIERIVEHLNIGTENPEPAKKTKTPKNAFRHHYISADKPAQEAAPVAEPVQEPVEEIKPAKAVIRKRKRVITRKPVETVTATPEAATTLLGRDEIMNIIQTMRAQGATFDQVASHLVDLGQPTFSGRGEWHAQTIHRLCNKK